MFNIDVTKLKDIDISIYKYILKNRDKVVFMTIRELSEELHVSTTTILRFCKKAGFEGFSELKVNLKKEVKTESYKSTLGEIDILDEFIKNIPLAKKGIEEAKEAIFNSKLVLFIGTGSSGAIATYGAKYMAHFNKFALSIDDPYYPFNLEALEGAVAIILSTSGENASLIEVSEKLKEMGIKTVSITNKKTSTISKLTDYTINYYISQEGYNHPDDNFLGYSDITSQMPAIYIIENLSKEIGKMNEEKFGK